MGGAASVRARDQPQESRRTDCHAFRAPIWPGDGLGLPRRGLVEVQVAGRSTELDRLEASPRGAPEGKRMVPQEGFEPPTPSLRISRPILGRSRIE